MKKQIFKNSMHKICTFSFSCRTLKFIANLILNTKNQTHTETHTHLEKINLFGKIRLFK